MKSHYFQWEACFIGAFPAGNCDFRCPLAGHLRFHSGAILAGGGSSENFAEAVHDQIGHFQAEFKRHVADIDERAVGIAEFNEQIVPGGAEGFAFGKKVGRQILYIDSREWRPGDFSDGRRFMQKIPVTEIAGDAEYEENGHGIKKIKQGADADGLFFDWRWIVGHTK